jgi:hypothetical protein
MNPPVQCRHVCVFCLFVSNQRQDLPSLRAVPAAKYVTPHSLIENIFMCFHPDFFDSLHIVWWRKKKAANALTKANKQLAATILAVGGGRSSHTTDGNWLPMCVQ